MHLLFQPLASETDVHETLDAPVTPPVEQANLLEDLIDIFVSPAKVFARRANSGFFLVMLILTTLIGVLYFANQGALQGIMDAEFGRQIETIMKQNPSMTSEQVEGMRGVMEMSTKYAVIAFIPIIVLGHGLLNWLVGKIFGASLTYKASAMIAAFAYMPRVIESVLVAVQGLVLDTASMRGRFDFSIGAGRFMDPDTTSLGLLGIVGRIDVFTIWITILTGIGISVVGKVPREKGMMAAAVIWVIGALPAVYQLVTGS